MDFRNTCFYFLVDYSFTVYYCFSIGKAPKAIFEQVFEPTGKINALLALAISSRQEICFMN
jgi:hypothetical protein